MQISVGVGVVLLAVLIWAGVSMWKNSTPKNNEYSLSTPQNQESSNQTPTTTDGTSPQPPADSQPSPVSRPSASTSEYTKLVAQYEGRRIQFGELCQATPNNVTFKNGTSILLDNRADEVRTMQLGNKSYTLAAYGYRVVTLNYSPLPYTITLDCNKQYNVATILIQK